MESTDFSVLIADDNDLNCWLMAEQLQQWTADITTAVSGQDAWQKLQDNKYALVFMDLHMPILNGWALVEKVRRGDSVNLHTPVIAVTAQIHNQQLQPFLDAGFNDCLFKPILLRHLQQIIEKWLVFPVEDIAGDYAGKLVKKMDYNRQLSQQILLKLFAEVPQCLNAIQSLLEQLDYPQAWQLAHKLHGTFCFSGFADFLPIIENLEQCILGEDGYLAMLRLGEIEARFSRLQDHQAAILAGVLAEARLQR